jgi:predicted TIM-barrel fold metal-dependent hydrolase
VIDYLCNAFTPDRVAAWDSAIVAAGSGVKIRRDSDDGFAEPDAMVGRMDELGITSLLLVTGDLDGGEFTPVAARWDETAKLAERWPGRFAALALIDPSRGSRGIRTLRSELAEPWVVGGYVHTHSFDLRLDAAEYYPYYALAGELDVPVVMQTGVSGGQMPSECAKPITIDRAALYFPDVRFVLSHTGWPWVDEAIAMARTNPNVFVGTASYPPRRWPAALIDFLASEKVVWGTNFPTVGHRQAITQLRELSLDRHAPLLEATTRQVFTRLPTS